MPFLLTIFNLPPNAYFHHLPPLSGSQVHTQFRECLMLVDCFLVCTWCVLNEAKRVLLCCPFVDCPLRLYSCWRKHHELLMAMLATSVTSTAIMYEIFFWCYVKMLCQLQATGVGSKLTSALKVMIKWKILPLFLELGIIGSILKVKLMAGCFSCCCCDDVC